jgi:N-acetylmuramic acid 6-phosphate etherase
MFKKLAGERFQDIDILPASDALMAMWEGQQNAVKAVKPALPALAAAVNAAAEALSHQGRIIYVGAGTSGRVAVQDGVELTPTFGWSRKRLMFLMAGGEAAFVSAVEGAEDDSVDGRVQIEKAGVGPQDVVIGVAASGSTPYAVAAIAEATSRGAVTIGLSCLPDKPLLTNARYPVLIQTGAEIIDGSTRMQAGTAQKAALNLLSTGIMLRLGRVYRGRMVHMQISNAKLQRRAVDMVAEIGSCSRDQAEILLSESSGNIRVAILRALGCSGASADDLLARSGDNLRQALALLHA